MSNIEAVVFDHDGTLVNTTGYPPKLFEGMKDCLSDLRAKGLKLYIWTARTRRSTVEILEYLGIMSQFELLSCGGESSAKPSSEGIKDILFDLDPKKVVVIGDSLGDMIGGSHFGGITIGAMWGHGSARAEQVMKENGADACFLKVEDFKKYILEKIEE